jgi:hypothetical protein
MARGSDRVARLGVAQSIRSNLAQGWRCLRMAWSMIPKSGNRFLEKIMLKQGG